MHRTFNRVPHLVLTLKLEGPPQIPSFLALAEGKSFLQLLNPGRNNGGPIDNIGISWQVKMGPLTVSPMGFGTWAWGNQLLWGYEESMDSQLQDTFNLALDNGINLFDTADSYGTGRLNGQSEKLLGKFIREFQGAFFSFSLESCVNFKK